MGVHWQTQLQKVWFKRFHVVHCVLWPLSVLYGAVTALHRFTYQLGICKAQSVTRPVLVVGNWVAGGAGKTPVVIELVKFFQSKGVNVGVISRGYGRQGHDGLVLKNTSTALEVGDEPLLIYRRTKAPVAVCASRIKAAGHLLSQHPEVDLIISDDGLQHYALKALGSLCVMDERGLGNGYLLPAGALRTRPHKVDWIVMPRNGDMKLLEKMKTSDGNDNDEKELKSINALRFYAREELKKYATRGLYGLNRRLSEEGYLADGKRVALHDIVDHPAVCAITGIAKPESFFSMLDKKGVHNFKSFALKDHANLLEFKNAVQNLPKDALLVCTEKDAVKLHVIVPTALAVPLICELETDLLDNIWQWWLDKKQT